MRSKLSSAMARERAERAAPVVLAKAPDDFTDFVLVVRRWLEGRTA